MFVGIFGGVYEYLKIICRSSGLLDCVEIGVIAFYGCVIFYALNLYGWWGVNLQVYIDLNELKFRWGSWGLGIWIHMSKLGVLYLSDDLGV